MAEDGTARATAEVVSEETQRRLREAADTRARLLAGPAAAIDSSIVLVWECMQALPKLLTGTYGGDVSLDCSVLLLPSRTAHFLLSSVMSTRQKWWLSHRIRPLLATPDLGHMSRTATI